MVWDLRPVSLWSLLILAAWARKDLSSANPTSDSSLSAGSTELKEPTSATPIAIVAAAPCTANTTLVDVCPGCDGLPIKYSQVGYYAVECDSGFAGVTYHPVSFITTPTVYQCAQACINRDGCYAPAIGPGGTCYQVLAPVESDLMPTAKSNYALLLARFTGGGVLPPLPNPPQSVFKSATTTSASSAIKTCQASKIACPRCNNARVQDTSGTTYEVVCRKEAYSEKHLSVQRQLTPEGCLHACSNHTRCKGATFWSEGNCELATGEDVFPVKQLDRTAFISIDPNYTPTTIPPSAIPTTPADPVFSSSVPSLKDCDRKRITCPQCDGLKVKKGLKKRYKVRCNVQPMCKGESHVSKVDSAEACAEACDSHPNCGGAIYKSGRCVACKGPLKSLKPYLLPHRYVVFVAEEGKACSG